MATSTAAACLMEAESTRPAASAVMPCLQGNRFWLENLSDTPRSITFEVNGSTSPILPQTAETYTLLPNTLPGSGGSLVLNVDGQSCEVVRRVDTSFMSRPEDLRGAVIIGEPRQAPPEPIAAEVQGIPFTDTHETADLADFLPEGVSEANTEIDMVMVLRAVDSPHAIRSEGFYDVDALSDGEAEWLLQSLAVNTIGNAADATRTTLVDVRRSFDVSSGREMRAVLREVIFGARFYVKSIASWGGEYAIIFKGSHRGRAFLTAIMYGLRHQKMGFISSYADIAQAVQRGGMGAAAQGAVRGVPKGNLIGFMIAGALEVSNFVQSEDPEKNWGALLGGLSVAFVKVWVAGFGGALAAGAVVWAAGAGIIAAAPVVLVIVAGVGAAIAVGFLLDGLDQWLGVSDAARKIGQSLGSVISDAAEATSAFVDRIVFQPIETLLDNWMNDFKDNLRRQDPTGYCILFCDSQLDQGLALHRFLRRF